MAVLGPGAEFDRIRDIARALGNRSHDLGDDCAFIPFSAEFAAISSDISIEEVHFSRRWMTGPDIGWRAAAAALSDLAAVGADPVGILVSLALPPQDASDAAAIMQGVGDAVDAVGAKVLGGDLARSSEWVVDMIAVGRVSAPVRRSGAKPGDGLWVTGALGGARAGLTCLQANRELTAALRRAFIRPTPRIRAGQWLARHGAHAMLDLSDGLAGDAGHLAAASAVALTIELDRLPVAEDVEAAAGGQHPAAFAAIGGEDYELLAALAPEFSADDAGAFTRETGLPLTRIGSVRQGSGVSLLLGGTPVTLQSFDHFR